ncbi:MAG: transcription antitermination factor NusB [candidate division Zixibacteria bacterium]|nr:transcription antitermination factor NusB [candidate division Zixibacteria bacterium]
MSSRRRAREHVLKALYAFEIGDQATVEVFDRVIEKNGLDANALKFARTLFGRVVDHLDDIDKHIDQLATNWKLERIAIVDKNILRMAIAEVEYMPEVPIRVAVNEAIELAKRYSTLESAAFVNGILDRVLHEHEANE